MRERLASVLGGVGLAAAVVGFSQAATATDPNAVPRWSAAIAIGLVAFLWSAFRSKPTDRPGH